MYDTWRVYAAFLCMVVYARCMQGVSVCRVLVSAACMQDVSVYCTQGVCVCGSICRVYTGC